MTYKGRGTDVDFEAEHVIGDKGYDSAEFTQFIQDLGAVLVIPPRSNLKTLREYDKFLYRERYFVACFINKASITGTSSLASTSCPHPIWAS